VVSGGGECELYMPCPCLKKNSAGGEMVQQNQKLTTLFFFPKT